MDDSDFMFPRRRLPDGRVLDVVLLIMGTARLTISQDDQVGWVDDSW